MIICMYLSLMVLGKNDCLYVYLSLMVLGKNDCLYASVFDDLREE